MIRRPVLRYHGGKWRLAPWIIENMPPHRIYVEAFGGAGSVLMRKPRSYGEVFNDLDDEVINVFRVLQDPSQALELRRLMEVTPFSRREFRRTYEAGAGSVDAAHKMIIRAFMGFGSASSTRMHVTGFRSNSSRCGTTPAWDWANWPQSIPAFVERLRGVVIECRDAIAVMAQHDSPQTLHYVDPPYVQSTRSSLRNKNGNRGHYYRHDMEDTDHWRLLDFLQTLDGMVMLSGYHSSLYDDTLSRWTALERDHMADGARPRREVLWLNEKASSAQRQKRLIA